MLVSKASDTVGNTSNKQYYFIEKDSVSPASPIVNTNLTGDILAQYLNLKVQGEGNSKVDIKITNNRNEEEINRVTTINNTTGEISLNNITKSKLSCETEYTITTTLTDLAENTSTTTTITINTLDCPKCSTYDIVDKTTNKSTIYNTDYNQINNLSTTNTSSNNSTTSIQNQFQHPLKGKGNPYRDSHYFGAYRNINGRVF